MFTISVIIGVDDETIDFEALANSLNLSFGTAFLMSDKEFLSLFFIPFVTLELLFEPSTPDPRSTSLPISLNAWTSGNPYFLFNPSIISFVSDKPVCALPELSTFCNSVDAFDKLCWSSPESTRVFNCASPFSNFSFKSSIISFVTNLGDFWLDWFESPPSFFAIKSGFGLILLVYPVNGSKGEVYSLVPP